MVSIKSFFIVLVVSMISSYTSNAQNVFKIEIEKKVVYNKKKNIYLKLKLFNNTSESIEIIHPGILFSAFDGNHPFNSTGFSFGLYNGDTLINWEGNCDMKPEKPIKKIVLNDGIFIIKPSNIDKLEKTRLVLHPKMSNSIELLLVLSDCYNFSGKNDYIIKLTYNNLNNFINNPIESNKLDRTFEIEFPLL